MTLVTVDDCQRAQTAWFTALAGVSGGRTWADEGLNWCWTPGTRTLSLLFPESIPQDALARGVREARRMGVTVGAWLSPSVNSGPLADAGFERGWEPWWMCAAIEDVGVASDSRVTIETVTPEYANWPSQRAQMDLVQASAETTWHAVARAGGLLGHAWSHLDGAIAGVFDMAVWPEHRREGLGSALLQTVCSAAGAAGATHAVLNATVEGERLYSSRGFERLGDGITWWLHPQA